MKDIMKPVTPEDTARALVSRYSELTRRERERAASIAARVKAVVPELAAASGATRVFLFGSLAWGGTHSRTDVDLAVEGMQPEQLAIFAAAVEEELDAEVDVVPMERAAESLRRRVLEDGELLYIRSRGRS